MGAPKNHPFLGNQYTDGGYISGSYTYDFEPAFEEGLNTIKNIVKKSEDNEIKPSKFKLSNEDINKLADLKKSISLKNLSSKDKFIIGGIVVAASSIAGTIIYKFIKKKNDQKRITLENVGICMSCGHSLIDSEFHYSGNEETAYIQCNKCGTKNFAHFNESNSDESKEDLKHGDI